MFINSDNFDDVKKYFQHTYVKFKETGDHIWHIDSVSPSEMICSDKSKEEVGIDLQIGYNLEYILPRKAAFQLGEYAVMLSRIPARQWKKGLCKANTAFHRLAAEGSWLADSFNISMIEGFVNKPSYYNIDLALQQFRAGIGLQSVAITPRISVTNTGKIFIDQTLVGRFSLENNEAICKKIFQSELAKVFPLFKFKLV